MRVFLFGIIVAALVGLAGTAFAQDDDSGDRLVDLATRYMDERASRWVCPTTVKEVCTAGGCESAAPTITIHIDFESSAYSRCDAQGCDAYKFLWPQVSGIYTILEAALGTFFKALNDGSEFVEVATLGLSVHTAHGNCTPQ